MNDRKMKPQFITVPFKADSEHGVTEYNGIAKFSPAGIVIEFDSKFLGLIGGEVKEVRVSLEEILDIKFRKGIYKFFAKIQLRSSNFTKLAALPNEGGKVNLKVKREDFECAQKAVEQTLQYMSDVFPQSLQDGNNLNEQLPPARTSINELFDTKKLKIKDPQETNKLGKNTD